MGRFNLVQLESIYFTDDGTSGGLPCKASVAGLDQLSLTRTGSHVQATDGSIHTFLLPFTGKGVPLSIKAVAMAKTVFGSIKDLLSDTLENTTTATLVITGDTGDFSLEVKPQLPLGLAFSGKFINSRVYDVSINVIVDSINSIDES